jgi:glyoxylase-like metal-dependent hydrolase (beta-lactamase superfamily II)
MTSLNGKVHVTEQLGLKVHTYTAPVDGWVVNTHFVELQTQLIAIDAQYAIPCAKEALAYAATLGKPLTRLYVTHYHPDHSLVRRPSVCRYVHCPS